MRAFNECIKLTFLVTLALAEGPLSGYKVIRIQTENKNDIETLRELLSKSDDIDVWKEPSCPKCGADIRLSPLQYDDVISALNDTGFRTTTLIEDVQLLIDDERRVIIEHRRQQKESFDYGRYHNYNEIYDWVQNMAKLHGNIASTFTVGKSYQGRNIIGIKVGGKSKKPKGKRSSIWLQGGLHAREWASPATVLFIASKLMNDYKSDKMIKQLVDKFDWYILPVANPDGYTYSWYSSQSRLWRKTRSRQGFNCYGTDANRNWDMAWCRSASSNPCAETYCGPRVSSEPEVKAIGDFVSKIKILKAVVDVHSYSQMWLTPWGYTSTRPKHYSLLMKTSKKAVDALRKVHNTYYVYGPVSVIIYVASGGFTDWTYGKLNVKHSYSLELRDRGQYGFLLPQSQLIPTGEETLAGILTMAKSIRK